MTQQTTGKKFDPMEGVTYVPYPRHVVEALDKLLEYKFRQNIPDVIGKDDTASWFLVGKIYELWKTIYPHEYDTFLKGQQEYWNSLKNQYGASDREKGGAQIRAISAIPQRFEKLFHVFFPLQSHNKKFLLTLNKHFPEFQAYKTL